MRQLLLKSKRGSFKNQNGSLVIYDKLYVPISYEGIEIEVSFKCESKLEKTIILQNIDKDILVKIDINDYVDKYTQQNVLLYNAYIDVNINDTLQRIKLLPINSNDVKFLKLYERLK